MKFEDATTYAGYSLMALGSLHVILSVIGWSDAIITDYDNPTPTEIMERILVFFTFASGAFSIIMSIFLMLSKRWAYIMTWIISLASIVLNGIALLATGATRWYGLFFNMIILLFLIQGAKDFKKKDAKA